MIAAAPGDEIVENSCFICVLYGKKGWISKVDPGLIRKVYFVLRILWVFVLGFIVARTNLFVIAGVRYSSKIYCLRAR